MFPVWEQKISTNMLLAWCLCNHTAIFVIEYLSLRDIASTLLHIILSTLPHHVDYYLFPKAFHIVKTQEMSDDNKHLYEDRRTVVAIIAITVVVLYIFQLFYLQIYQNKYKDSADSNAFFKKVLYPARGTISDRSENFLVYNKPTYDIVFVPKEVHDLDTLEFCKVLNITVEDFKKRMNDVRDFRLNPLFKLYRSKHS